MIIVFALVSLISAPLGLLYSFVGFQYASKQWKKVLPVFILTVAAMAYAYTPVFTGNVDLWAYFNMLSICSNKTLVEVVEWFNDGLITENVMFWALGHVGVPHLLPAITVGTIYGVAGYITCDTATNTNSNSAIGRAILFQICMIPFLSLVQNIRNVFAFSLIILAVYRDLVKHDRGITTWLLYVLPCFIHITAIMIVLLRILVVLAKKNLGLVILLTATVPSLSNAFVVFGSKIKGLSAIAIFIRTAARKLYGYTSNTAAVDWASQVQSSVIQIAMRCICMTAAIIFLIIIYWMLKNKKRDDFHAFLALLCITTLACQPIKTPAYWRFSAGTMVAIGNIYVPLLHEYKTHPSWIRSLIWVLWGLMGLFAVIQLRSFYSAFTRTDYLYNLLATSTYSIIIDIFKSLI